MFGKQLVKEKTLSPRDALTQQIEQLTPGQETMFRLAEMYGPEIIIVVANKDYPGHGPRYSVLSAPPLDGRPGPKRNTIWQPNKAKPIAEWLIGRNATPFV